MNKNSIEEILETVLEYPQPARREQLGTLCGGDEALYQEVLSLLDAFEAAPEFLVAPPRLDRAVPARLGRYRVHQELGRGGAGIVYLAEDDELNRLVAIKTLVRAGRPQAARLQEEARHLASISHPNVAAVYSLEEIVADAAGAAGVEPHEERPAGAGSAAGGSCPVTLILTMEYVPGETLARRLGSGPLPFEDGLEHCRQIAAGLEAAHGQSIVHRDLKPQNIRITPDGWVKILDFGLAGAVDRAGETGVAGLRGTPGYMSPEQIEGAAAGDRSDLWALGAILYECFTGTPAIGGRSIAEMLARAVSREIDWSALPAAIPARVGELIRSCLEHEISKRPPSAGAVRRVLEEELLRVRAMRLFPTTSLPAKPAGNLPASWSSFFGRDALLAQLEQLARDHRLLTITGPGGVGKTRTAVELATRLRASFRDGAWFIDLSPLSDGEGLARLAARSLSLDGVRAQAPERAIMETVAASLVDREALIVLDNCEHVLGAAGQFVVCLLDRCPGLRVIATSRALLGVPGEQTVAVAPLPVPATVETGAREMDAVRLFEARARLRDPAFHLDGARLRIGVDIVRHLDGLPLAIELAAGHTRFMPLSEIRQRVVEGRPLPGGVALRPARHRSMGDLVDWSYRLLRPEEQRLFRRLAAFRGGWTLEMAEEICAWDGIERWQVCGAMSRLVEQSLVELQLPGNAVGEAGPARYRFLDTVRRAAGDLLQGEPEERERVESRFVSVLTGFAARRVAETGIVASAWVERIEAEYANLERALDLALPRRLDAAMRLATELGEYWLHVGYWSEGLARISRVTLAWDGAPVGARESARPYDVIMVFAQAARLAARIEESVRSRELALRGVALARDLGDDRTLASTLKMAGGAAWFRADLDEAESYWRESAGLYRALGNRTELALCIGNLGALSTIRGDHIAAEGHFRELLAQAEAVHDPLGLARALGNLGRNALERGDPQEARVRLERALALYREVKEPLGTSVVCHSLGDAWLELGDLARARQYLVESMRVREELGQKSAVCETLASLAVLAGREGHRALAAGLLRGTLRAYQSGIPHPEIRRTRVLALLRDFETGLGEQEIRDVVVPVESLSFRDLVVRAVS